MLGSLISAGASLIGSVIGGRSAAKSQEKTNEQNVALGREQMAFQERMSSTAYQRAVKDMQEAGLNPMLAYSQGGASAPMGSMPQVQNAVSQGVSSAAQSMQAISGIAQILQSAAATDKMAADADKVRSETMTLEANTAQQGATLKESVARERLTWEQREEVTERIKLLREQANDISAHVSARHGAGAYRAEARTKVIQEEIAKLEQQLRQADIPRAKSEEQFYERLGQANPWMRFILEAIKGVQGAKGVLK